MKAIKQTLLALALASTFTTANATPVDWSFTNAIRILDSSGLQLTASFTGSFTYDADTGIFSNVSIWNGIWDTITQLDANTYQISGNAQTWDLDFATDNALTNAGGSLSFTGQAIDNTGHQDIYYSGTLVGTPQATASAVPEPEVYAMMLAGLGLVGFAARRQQAV